MSQTITYRPGDKQSEYGHKEDNLSAMSDKGDEEVLREENKSPLSFPA